MLDKLSAEMTSGSLRHIVYALMDFGEWAKAVGLITHCAVLRADVPPENPPPAITVHTAAEVELLVNSARGRGLRWWAFLAFLADTGRRVGEALGIRWEWLRLHEERPYVALPWTKAARPQYVPLSRRLIEEVFTPENMAALKHCDNACPRTKSPSEYVFPWRYSNVHTRYQRYCETVGVEYRGTASPSPYEGDGDACKGCADSGGVDVVGSHQHHDDRPLLPLGERASDYAKYLDG